ncbi:hypothetical protein [Pseudomonas putida]
MSDDPSFVVRKTEVVDVASLNREYLHPESIRLQIDRGVRISPLDFGCFAYTRRLSNSASDLNDGDLVDLSSLDQSRCEMLRSLFPELATYRSHKTILLHYRLFSYALKWCDENDCSDAFTSPERAAQAYVNYTDYVYHLIATEQIRPNGARDRQNALWRLINARFPSESNHIKRTAITVRGGPVNNPPPKDTEMTGFFDNCLAIGRTLRTFLIEGATFPVVVEVCSEEVVIFPGPQGVISPFRVDAIPAHSYNVSERRIATVDEFIAAGERVGVRYNKSAALRCLSGAARVLNESNCDPRHPHRQVLGSLALKAYACVFLQITGASITEFIAFDHLESLHLEKSNVKKDLTAVKMRAGGKVTKYVVGGKLGLTVLREYLALRQWVLNGRVFDKLFFSMNKYGGKYTGDLSPLNDCFTNKFYRTVRGIYMPFSQPLMVARKIRKYKSSYLHSLRESPDLIASTLAHTTTTNLSSYAWARPEVSNKEFSVYWNAIRAAARRLRARHEMQGTGTPAGHCESFQNPTSLGEDSPIEPNCGNQYGCFYCTNYILHADKEDLHKLVSVKYVAEAVRRTFADAEHANQIFQDLLCRIDVLLEEVCNLGLAASNIVAEVMHMTFKKGVLTPFWEKRLQRYEHLGVNF